MVKNSVGSVIIGVGPSNNTNHRQILTVRSGNRVQYTEPTDRESNRARADATRARVAVSGVSSVELVAAANVGESGLGDEVVEQGQVEVTGNGEDVGDADLDESAGQVAAQSGVGRVEQGGGHRVLDC